jgi:hypothetical protein
MEVFMATMETSDYLLDVLEPESIKYALVSFLYVKDQAQFDRILSKVSGKILIDSGAHSFQHGAKADFGAYTDRYCDFVRRNTNNPKVEGFFEMDIDNVIGIEGVERLRKRLDSVSSKIIPVWHHFRGVANYIEMCKQYKGRKVSITGFSGGDIKDGQFNLFINTAHKYGCDIHVLGFTRYDLIKTLNLSKRDSVDSSSWKQTGIFGDINLPSKGGSFYKFDALEGLKTNYKKYIIMNCLSAIDLQTMYDRMDNAVPNSELIGGNLM